MTNKQLHSMYERELDKILAMTIDIGINDLVDDFLNLNENGVWFKFKNRYVANSFAWYFQLLINSDLIAPYKIELDDCEVTLNTTAND